MILLLTIVVESVFLVNDRFVCFVDSVEYIEISDRGMKVRLDMERKNRRKMAERVRKKSPCDTYFRAAV